MVNDILRDERDWMRLSAEGAYYGTMIGPIVEVYKYPSDLSVDAYSMIGPVVVVK